MRKGFGVSAVILFPLPQHLHAVVDGGVTYKDPSSGQQLDIEIFDAPVVSIGDTNPFPTPSGTWQPDPSKGVFSCLYDNIWG